MTRIVREPLIYFLLLGGLLFVLFDFFSDSRSLQVPGANQISISEGRLRTLVLGFEKAWQRAPVEAELVGLIQSYIREEIFYREALAMGLDRDDPVVRRRMQQKMEFITQDLVELAAPTRQELQEFLEKNAALYRQPTRFSFRQVYVNPANHNDPETVLRKLLAALREQVVDASAAGDSLPVQHEFIDQTERNIERALGTRFLQELNDTSSGDWQGPVKSGFGVHLVNISDRKAGLLPRIDDILEQLERDWSAAQRRQANAAYYDQLRSGYTIELPSAVPSAVIEQVVRPGIGKIRQE